MRRTYLFLLAVLIVSAFNTKKTYSQDDQMKAFMDYMTPGKEHQMLAKANGEWDCDLQLWMDPSAPPTVAKGTATFEMILGGRYQMSKQNSNVMGMPMNGINIVGFDNGKKVFVNTWIDNMGTGIMYAEGPYDEATQTITYKGKSYEPSSAKEVEFREIFKFLDDNNFILEMFMAGKDGKEFKSMEAKYKKK
jgi:hypothetical protein